MGSGYSFEQPEPEPTAPVAQPEPPVVPAEDLSPVVPVESIAEPVAEPSASDPSAPNPADTHDLGVDTAEGGESDHTVIDAPVSPSEG